MGYRRHSNHSDTSTNCAQYEGLYFKTKSCQETTEFPAQNEIQKFLFTLAYSNIFLGQMIKTNQKTNNEEKKKTYCESVFNRILHNTPNGDSES